MLLLPLVVAFDNDNVMLLIADRRSPTIADCAANGNRTELRGGCAESSSDESEGDKRERDALISDKSIDRFESAMRGRGTKAEMYRKRELLIRGR